MTENTSTAAISTPKVVKAKAPKVVEKESMALNLETMSAKQLETLISNASNILHDVKAREASEMKSRIASILNEGGFTMDELFGAIKTKRRKSARDSHDLAPKFRNPENREQTWTGLGRRPKWLQEAIKNGEDLESFRI